jgi:hypothetical protein
MTRPTLSVCIPLHDRDMYSVADGRAFVAALCRWVTLGADEICIGNTGQNSLVRRAALPPNHVFQTIPDDVMQRCYEWHVPQTEWRPGAARNYAAMAATSDVLIHTGADIMVEDDSIDHLRDLGPMEIETCLACVMLSAAETNAIVSGAATTVNSSNVFPRAPGAFLAIRRDTFMLKVRFYNNEMCGWGWEDVDLLDRARHTLKMKHRVGPLICWHLHHKPPVPRDAHGPNLEIMRKFQRENWYRYGQ